MAVASSTIFQFGNLIQKNIVFFTKWNQYHFSPRALSEKKGSEKTLQIVANQEKGIW